MNNIINQIINEGLPDVMDGRAPNVDDFFEQLIKPQFTNKDAIKATHKTLLEYIKQSDAVYVLRLYGSDPNKNYNNLRRGFLSIFPKGEALVFCDNTFAMPFAAMKLCGKTYTTEALKEYMNDRTTRVGFRSTKEERELAFYNWEKNKSTVNLNLQGWYLAHILPVGKNYGNKNLSELFINPEREEWLEHPDHIRRPQKDLTEKEVSILKAHFLRMIHPLNSFLVPKRALLDYDGNNIGEDPEVLQIVSEYIKNEFSEEYTELTEIIMKPDEISSTASSTKTHSIGEIIWRTSQSNINKKASKPKSGSKSHRNQSTKIDEDFNIDNAEDRLENTLRSIGKEAFIKLYPLLKENINIDLAQVIKKYPEYSRYSATSQKTRLSNSKRIINSGQEKQVLENIAYSRNLKSSVTEEARSLLHSFHNEVQI